MALRRTLAKRIFGKNRDQPPSPFAAQREQQHAAGNNSPNAPILPPTSFHREYLTSPLAPGFLRRFLLQRRAINQSSSSTIASKLPEFLTIPLGDKLREKLFVSPDRFRPSDGEIFGALSVNDAKKILRCSQMEKVKAKLKQMPVNSITHSEFVEICCQVCENYDQGVEFAKMLDESGSVIVLGNVVFLRPDQVAKSMEQLITQSIAMPNDPRRKELEEMEKQKAAIDKKAESLVRGELYCGLGFLLVQTLGFMRLTFWELSWDVMEPICFFVTSLHFALAYGFFLRTAKEPSFEGYFQRRFRVKQRKLMQIHNFDAEKYHRLCEAFYHGAAAAQAYNSGFRAPASDHRQAGGAVFGSLHG